MVIDEFFPCAYHAFRQSTTKKYEQFCCSSALLIVFLGPLSNAIKKQNQTFVTCSPQVIAVAATKSDTPMRRVQDREGREWAASQGLAFFEVRICGWLFLHGSGGMRINK